MAIGRAEQSREEQGDIETHYHSLATLLILAPYSYSPQPGPFIRFTGLFFCPLTSLISQLCLGCQVFLQCNLVRAPWPASLASRNTNARSPPQSVIFFSNSETPPQSLSISLSLSYPTLPPSHCLPSRTTLALPFCLAPRMDRHTFCSSC